MAIGNSSASAGAHLERQSKLKGCKGSYELLRTSPILKQKDAHDDEHHAKQLLTQRRAGATKPMGATHQP